MIKATTVDEAFYMINQLEFKLIYLIVGIGLAKKFFEEYAVAQGGFEEDWQELAGGVRDEAMNEIDSVENNMFQACYIFENKCKEIQNNFFYQNVIHDQLSYAKHYKHE